MNDVVIMGPVKWCLAVNIEIEVWTNCGSMICGDEDGASSRLNLPSNSSLQAPNTRLLPFYKASILLAQAPQIPLQPHSLILSSASRSFIQI